MAQIKSTICAVALLITISSTVLAGNIPSRSGNIASRTGNIPSQSGNIASRSGIIPDSAQSGSLFGFSENIGRLIQLLLQSGLY